MDIIPFHSFVVSSYTSPFLHLPTPLILIQPHSRLLLDPRQVDLVTEEFSDVVHAVLHHSRALETESETVHTHVLGETHWLQHLGAEETRVTDLDPAVETCVC